MLQSCMTVRSRPLENGTNYRMNKIRLHFRHIPINFAESMSLVFAWTQTMNIYPGRQNNLR